MAEESASNATLKSTSHIPIAQLTPLLAAPSTRSVKAIVSLTWPYSSATGSVAFLLAEPDFRLRRTRGQVRVQFSGSSAKKVAKSGIASGDEVVLCLDGVEFIYDEATVSTPGRGVEFELRFTERLLLQFRQEGVQAVNLIDLDHPAPEVEAIGPARIPTPEPEQFLPSTSTNGTPARPEIKLAADEFSSPAFIKRARTSYGSFFEGGLEDEDGTVKGKGRKRTRLSSTWRYTSRSPTPEIEVTDQLSNTASPDRVVKPAMTDEGVQTIDGDNGAAEALAGLARQSANMGRDSYAKINGAATASDDVSLQQNGTKHTLHTEFAEKDDYQAPVTGQNSPSSSQLQALPSENLSLVSTSDYRGFGAFAEQAGVSGMPSENQEDRPAVVSEKVEPPVEEDHDDIYTASPTGRHGEYLDPTFHGFQAPEVGIGMSDIETSHPLEDQYGHWQSEISQMSHVPSPLENDENGEHDNFRLGSQDEERYHNHGLPTSPRESGQAHQYPDLDDVLAGHQLSSTWGQGAVSFAYPELPDHGDNLDSLVHSLSQPRSAAMSRSISAQSAVVDLTESDEEDEGKEKPEEVTMDEDPDQRPSHQDGLTKGEEYEEDYDEEEEEQEHPVDVSRSRHFARNLFKGDRESEVSEEEEYYSDDELDEDGNPYPRLPNATQEEDFYSGDEDEENGDPYPPGFYRGQEGDVDDEEQEGSYDEDDDMENEGPPGRVQPEPVVIDLLSSDDEEEDIPARKASIRLNQQARPRNSDSENSDEDEGESKIESDEDVDDESVERHIERLNLPSTEPNIFAVISGEENSEDESSKSVEDENDDDRVEHRGEEARPQESMESEDHKSDMSLEDEAAFPEPISEPTGFEHAGDDDKNFQAEQRAHIQDSEVVPELSELERGSSDKENTCLPPRQHSRSKPEERHSSFGRVFSLDGANDEPDPEPEQCEEQQKPTETVLKSSDAPLEPHLRKQPQDRLSLFARMFNLDGANDDSDGEISYPDLPNIEPSPHATAPGGQHVSQDAGDQSQKTKNVQLPTPDATQLSQKAFSQDTAGYTTRKSGDMDEGLNGASTEKTPKPDTEDLGVNVDTAETVRTTDDAHQIETIFINKDTAKVRIEEIKDNEVKPSGAEDFVIERSTSTTEAPKPSQTKIVPEEPIFTAENPRRSHRRVKSTTVVNTKENVRPVTPVTPVKSIKAPSSVGKDPDSPMVVIDEHSMPKGHDASIELALSSLESPSKHHDLRHPPMTDLKLRLTRNLRTELEEFTALKMLRYHLNQKLDILAIATTAPPEPQRAKSGPRHYLIIFNITDPSVAPSGVTEVQVFRPYKEALPVVKAGEGILLRNFVVISVNRGFALRSETEASSWAVFKDSAEPEVRGPPVEYGNGEKNHITQMKVWYNHLDPISLAKLSRSNADKIAAGAGTGVAERKSKAS